MTSVARVLVAASLLGGGLPLASCTLGPDFVRPDPPRVTQYASGQEPTATPVGDGKAQRFEAGAKVPENWWKLFKSRQLDAVVANALSGSPTLQIALANLRQSRSNLMAGKGIYYPQASANLGVSREKTHPVSLGVNAPSNTFNLLTLSTSVSYVLDLFGAERRAVEALGAQVDYNRFTVLATWLTLTSNIVNTVIARAAYAAEIESTRKLLAAQREQVALTEANVRSGTAPYAAVLSLRAQLASTEATLPTINQKLAESEHLLAMLSGRLPAEWTPPEIGLTDLHLPEVLPKTLPSELARQRPDILQSEALLHAASAQVGVATAALYPSLTLSGGQGVSSASTSNLFSSESTFWSLGAGLTAPLFRGGTLRAQKQAAVDAFESSLAGFRQTVTAAFRQVADVLRALENDAELVQAQSTAASTAQEALELIQANYRAGTTGYLQLLAATAQAQQARLGYLQALAQRHQDTVALFASLGGGWWSSPAPSIEALVQGGKTDR